MKAAILALGIALVMLAGVVNAQSTGSNGGTCSSNCSAGDIMCYVASLPVAAECEMAQAVRWSMGGVTQTLFGGIYSLSLLNPSFNSVDISYYNDILYACESLFVLVLLFCGVKLAYSSMLGTYERMEAKQSAQRALVAMVLIALSLPIYTLALSLASSVAGFVGPSPTDFYNTATTLLPSNFILLAVLVISLILGTVFWVFRYVLAYAGLFLLPISLALEEFPFTGGIGRGLKQLVAANLAVQVLQALFLKMLVLVVAGTSADPVGVNAGLLGVGVFILGIAVTLAVYSEAFHAREAAGLGLFAINGREALKG